MFGIYKKEIKTFFNTLEKSSAKIFEASELIRKSSMEASTFSYIIMLPLYLYILFFAIKGHKIGLEKD